ncbi:MAG: hypothetical protein ACRDRY_19325 [Pseudonocardiaceae bacterium]
MSEPTSDALSGFDGTQAPEPLADPSIWPGHGPWGDVPKLPMWRPPDMDDTALREAIAAVLGDDAGAPTQAVNQDPPAAPAPEAEPQPTAPDAKVADVKVADVKVADVKVAAPPPSTASAGAPPAGAPSGRHGTEAFGRSVPRPPPVSTLIPPAPPHPRRPGGLRYRPPMAGASRESAPLTDLRRRISRERIDSPLRSRSDGGATAFVLTMLIIMGLLAYYVVTGFLDAVSRFLP